MAFLSQNAFFTALRMVGLASALLALVFVINNFLIFGIDAPGVINTLRLGDVFGVDIYEATHMRTNQKIYVTIGEIYK